MNDKQREAFRRQMRKGLPTEHGRMWHYAEEILSVAALLTWAGAIIYLLS